MQHKLQMNILDADGVQLSSTIINSEEICNIKDNYGLDMVTKTYHALITNLAVKFKNEEPQTPVVSLENLKFTGKSRIDGSDMYYDSVNEKLYKLELMQPLTTPAWEK